MLTMDDINYIKRIYECEEISKEPFLFSGKSTYLSHLPNESQCHKLNQFLN